LKDEKLSLEKENGDVILQLNNLKMNYENETNESKNEIHNLNQKLKDAKDDITKCEQTCEELKEELYLAQV
jgi:hypothetical protein